MYDIHLSIDSRLEQVRILSGALRGIGQELRLSEHDLGLIELIMVEAVNNTIEHAYEMHAGHAVNVHISYSPAVMKLVISDQGKSMPATLPMQAGSMPDPEVLPEGGWGWGLIHALADSIDYQRDLAGNHLHLTKQLR